jgi:hypothetical protein
MKRGDEQMKKALKIVLCIALALLVLGTGIGLHAWWRSVKWPNKAIEMKIGARGLRSVMEGVMTDVMYSVPSDPSVKKVLITAKSVREGSSPELIRE